MYVTFGEDLKFTYKEEMSGPRKEVLASEKNRNAALEILCKELQSASAGSDDLNSFLLPEAGTYNNFYSFSLFVLQGSVLIWTSKIGVNVLMDLYFEIMNSSSNENVGMRTGPDRTGSDRFADFSWFSIWFSVSVKNSNGFSKFFRFVFDLSCN